MSREIEITLPTLHPAQRQIREHPARFKVVCCGRRFGKTLLAIDDIVNHLLDGKSYGYFAPNNDDLKKLVWKPLIKILEPIIAYKNETMKVIETITGGTFIGFSMEVDRPGQGHKFHKGAIDEAASIAGLKEKFQESIQPTLVDHVGDFVFYSTPHGYEDFWYFYQLGQDVLQTDYASFHYTSYDNPYLSSHELDRIRLTVPARTWQQEYLAQFTADGGQVFRGVDKVTTLDPFEPYEGEFIFGVDWGRVNDFTAVSVIDIETRQQVAIERINKIGYTAQRNWLMTLYERWKPFRIIAEENSIGDANIDALRTQAWNEGHDDFQIDGFQTTSISKPIIIDDLTTAIERGLVQLQNDENQLGEFNSYALRRLPSGRFSFNAPSGGHDDTVIATALSYHGLTESAYQVDLED